MIYRLRILALGHGPGTELTAAEYGDLVAAMKRIYLASDMEEKLDLLLENYLEYEHELLGLGLRYSLFTSIDDDRSSREVQVLNRRTINLLGAARMYVDQVKHAVSRFFVGQDRPDVGALFSAEYDRHLEYRIAEALRNHSQHRSLPVHGLRWSAQWEEPKTPDRRLRFTMIPSINVSDLRDAGEFKASVLSELEASGRQRFSLTPILRRYLESLTTVHQRVRELLSDRAKLDHQTLMSALNRAQAEVNENTTGLAVTVGDNLEHVQERHFVTDRFWKRREDLMRKNAQFPNLYRRYVSAEHPTDIA